MKYEESIEKLCNADTEKLKAELNILKNRKDLSEDDINKILNDTVGILFSASKECKNEELYRVIRNNGEEIVNHSKTLLEENPIFGEDFIRIYGDPILPFIEGKIEEGEIISILTYRKAVEENPLALLLDGFPENSNVFNILKKDGFTDKGKETYLRITKFIKSELANEIKDEPFINKIKALLEGDNNSDAICYSNDGGEYIAINKNILDIYYCCTSVIVCTLDWIQGKGEIIEVTPLFRSNGIIKPGENIEYEEFGEVGSFTFEMTDYR